MNIETLIIAVAGVFAVASSIGVLLTKDNFYAALYMSVTMLFVAAIYAAFNLQPVVVIVALIFVGAVGIVTVAVAATYRARVSRQVSLFWTLPVIIVFGILAYAYYGLAVENLEITNQGVFSALPTDYFFVVVFLFSLVVVMMLSAVKLARGVDL
ncbi:NADH-quinone oxidoreductase subunit J [Archaeoglobus neptunius]|uniref:NADH-quinone oxidoreductase subunit J n=1 Tax=Archaeoglobus neptunius TaxID=2798580 RepID=UPI0019284710|nr:NADH-quinone oxidoreductase subunit J [Archaeoglobus neptunius]